MKKIRIYNSSDRFVLPDGFPFASCFLLQDLSGIWLHKKYIRFFAGAVLILLALEPFLGVRGMSGMAAEAFSGLVFESRGQDMEEKLLHMEKQQQAMCVVKENRVIIYRKISGGKANGNNIYCRR